jgi:hypothetical protein
MLLNDDFILPHAVVAAAAVALVGAITRASNAGEPLRDDAPRRASSTNRVRPR